MSGSELGRLMHEVTAQPPIDVDFGAVEHLVRRRRTRVRRAAGGAAAAAVAVIVAVPLLFPGPSSSDANRAKGPARPAGIGAQRQDSWNTLTWSVPAEWPASDDFGDHPRPSNAFIDGPYIGSTRIPMSPPTPRPTQGSGVLASAGPTLPEGAAVGWFSYGLRSDPLTPASFDSDAMTYLPARCASMGAAHTFHAVRQFGTSTAGSNLALDGCINATDPSTQEARLAAVLASVKDSAYPVVASTSVAALTPNASMSATTWPAAGVSWVTAFGWTATDKHVPDTTVDQVLHQNGALLSTAPLNAACTDFLSGFGCGDGKPVVTLGPSDAIAELSVSPSRNIEGDTGQFYPADDDGSFGAPTDACTAAGGAQLWRWSHLYGPRSNARRVQLTACLGASAAAGRVGQLKALADSITVKGFPDLNAGTDHPTLLPRRSASSTVAPSSRAGVRSGSTAEALCRAALGTFATATLTTISEVHAIPAGGPARPSDSNGAFGYADVFKGAPETDPAAWCWKLTDDGNGYEAWLVHAGDPPYPTGTKQLGLSQPPPSGAVLVPP